MFREALTFLRIASLKMSDYEEARRAAEDAPSGSDADLVAALENFDEAALERLRVAEFVRGAALEGRAAERLLRFCSERLSELRSADASEITAALQRSSKARGGAGFGNVAAASAAYRGAERRLYLGLREAAEAVRRLVADGEWPPQIAPTPELASGDFRGRYVSIWAQDYTAAAPTSTTPES
mmetsp:Transcript_73236/g.205677  ORF Transcript_73236/g.205677 Transcript_73236/m.205677 type:complete len:183 (+) Transcript_73236:1-549(+)